MAVHSPAKNAKAFLLVLHYTVAELKVPINSRQFSEKGGVLYEKCKR